MGKQSDSLVTVDTIVSEWASYRVGNDPNNKQLAEGEEDKLLVLAKVEARRIIKEEIKDELTEDERTAIKERAARAEEKDYAQRSAANVKSLLLEGFWAALFVGLLVNQITDIITYSKIATTEKAFLPTGIIILILLSILLLFILTRLSDSIVHLGPNKEKEK